MMCVCRIAPRKLLVGKLKGQGHAVNKVIAVRVWHLGILEVQLQKPFHLFIRLTGNRLQKNQRIVVSTQPLIVDSKDFLRLRPVK